MRHMMSKRWFYCPRCRSKMMAPKNTKHNTPIGHKKTMWCWKCQKYMTMIQYV